MKNKMLSLVIMCSAFGSVFSFSAVGLAQEPLISGKNFELTAQDCQNMKEASFNDLCDTPNPSELIIDEAILAIDARVPILEGASDQAFMQFDFQLSKELYVKSLQMRMLKERIIKNR